MSEQPDLSDEFRQALKKHGFAGAEISQIGKRECESEKYHGVEYEFYGSWIPIRPIIELVAEKDGFAIESIIFKNESTEDNDVEPKIIVFVADIRVNQPHPAFTE